MIKGIEEVCGNFEAILLMEFCLFSEPQIEVPYAVAAEGAAPAGSAVRSEEDRTKVLDSSGWIPKIVNSCSIQSGRAGRIL